MQKQYTDAWREQISKLLWHFQQNSKTSSRRPQAGAPAGPTAGNANTSAHVASASPRDASPSPYTTMDPHMNPSAAMPQTARPYAHQAYDGPGGHAAYEGSRPHAAPAPQMRAPQQQYMHGASHSNQQYVMYPMSRPERCADLLELVMRIAPGFSPAVSCGCSAVVPSLPAVSPCMTR